MAKATFAQELITRDITLTALQWDILWNMVHGHRMFLERNPSNSESQRRHANAVAATCQAVESVAPRL